MSLQNCKSSVELFQQHDPRQLVGKRHFSQGELKGRGVACCRRKTIGTADGKQQRWRAALQVLPKKISELLGGELLAASIEQHESLRRA